MAGETAPDRMVLGLTGTQRHAFLQGLVSNDVPQTEGSIAWTALLTPQGKYLADFFMIPRGDTILLDVSAAQAPMLAQRLSMYKLRADVAIAQTGLHVLRGLDAAPVDALADPRHPALGWRAYRDQTGAAPAIDWDAIRVAHCIPETGIELTPETFILEAGFDRLHGVNFRKGCYVGQEVTARMKHKTDLRKGLVTVRIAGQAPVGTVIMAGEKEAGTLFTQSGDHAIAYLRFDRATGPMQAGNAKVVWDG